MLGKINLFCIDPSTPTNPIAGMMLEVNGSNVPITDDCCGVKQFFQLCGSFPAFDGEISGAACSGGPAPNGFDDCQIFLNSPIDMPPMQKGHIIIGAVTMQLTHSGPYGIMTDSMMMPVLDWGGGQMVLNPPAVNQVGVIFNPRSKLPQDTHSPVITQAIIRLPSLVGSVGYGQRLAILNSGTAPINQNSFVFNEPNGGDFGIVALGGGQGIQGNMIEVLGAHGQKYGCVDLGHGSPIVGGGNIIKAIVGPSPAAPGNWPGTGIDYWGCDDILDLQVLPGEGGVGTRGITLEAGSSGLQCRMGKNVATTPIVVAAGSGHPKANFINGVAYS